MADIHITRDHNLGLDNARQEVEKLAQSLTEKLQADCEWNDNRLVFKSAGASGTIDVGANHVSLDIELGMAFSLLKGMIEDDINRRLDAALG